MNIRAFVHDVLDFMSDQRDEDLADLARAHGLCEVGDDGLVYTPELKAWLEAELALERQTVRVPLIFPADMAPGDTVRVRFLEDD